MSNRGRSLTIALAIAAAMVPACSSSAPRPAPLPPASVRNSALAATFASPSPELLLEMPILNRAEQVRLKAARTTPACTALETIDGLREPSPDDYDELYRYASSYRGQLSTVNLRSRVTDSTTGRKVLLPGPVGDALLMQQAQMHAFAMRINHARAVEKDAPKLAQAAADLAQIQLVNSTFTSAESVIAAARLRYCKPSI